MNQSNKQAGSEAEMKEWIDTSSYEDLLEKWRFAPFGDPIFKGEMGNYYEAVMKRKRKEVGEAEHTRASRSVGWNK